MSSRVREIIAWLNGGGERAPGVEVPCPPIAWAVVDDHDLPELAHHCSAPAAAEAAARRVEAHFVRTNDKRGLDEEAADRVERLLLQEEPPQHEAPIAQQPARRYGEQQAG